VRDVIDAPEHRRVAFLGGIYSNHLALRAALDLARRRGVDAVWALGDLGAFGPHPDRTVELIREAGVPVIMGNYEEALASGATDCHCGYTDPRDNHFAQLSYDYTAARTSPEHKAWMGSLPRSARLAVGGRRLLLSHGSPRRINEFLWGSTTPRPFVERLLREHDADLVVCTHTGLPWARLDADGRGVLNVGAVGRPANDGRTNVWMALVEATPAGPRAELLPVEYDHARLAREMREEGLPPEFVETIETGWWTTCLEVLPAKERGLGRH
jgi:predicted phosphodiesterase